MARAARGISQRELAERAGVKPSYVSMLERGERKNPSVEQVAKFARALSLPMPLLTLLGAGREDVSVMPAGDASRLARALLDVITEPEPGK